MDNIIKWIKGIACFYIIANFIIGMIPQEKYQKYGRLFVVIVMVLIVLAPLGKANLYFETVSLNLSDIAPDVEIKNSDDEILGAVEKNVVENICLYADSNGVGVTECNVVFDRENCETNGLISSITVTILDNENENEEVSKLLIKKYISDFYKLPMQNIYVNISKESKKGI